MTGRTRGRGRRDAERRVEDCGGVSGAYPVGPARRVHRLRRVPSSHPDHGCGACSVRRRGARSAVREVGLRLARGGLRRLFGPGARRREVAVHVRGDVSRARRGATTRPVTREALPRLGGVQGCAVAPLVPLPGTPVRRGVGDRVGSRHHGSSTRCRQSCVRPWAVSAVQPWSASAPGARRGRRQKPPRPIPRGLFMLAGRPALCCRAAADRTGPAGGRMPGRIGWAARRAPQARALE